MYSVWTMAYTEKNAADPTSRNSKGDALTLFMVVSRRAILCIYVELQKRQVIGQRQRGSISNAL